MKKSFDLCTAIILAIAVWFPIYPQDFPIGIYSGMQLEGNKFYGISKTVQQMLTTISDIGANMVKYPIKKSTNNISLLTAPTNESRAFTYIIPSNAYSDNEYINKYSSGYWTTWAPMSYCASLPAGDDGFALRYYSNSIDAFGPNTDTTYPLASEYFISGPSYKQDFRYSRNKRQYEIYCNPDSVYLINYNVTFSMMRGAKVLSGGDNNDDHSSKICRISAWLKNGDSNTCLLSRDVLITELDTAGFTEIELTDSTKVAPVPNNSYNYKRFVIVTNTPSPSPKAAGTVGKPEKVTKKITDGYATVEFRVKWYGHRKLYVKQVDVYDEIIGRMLKNNFMVVRANIINEYLNNFSKKVYNIKIYANKGLPCYRRCTYLNL